MLKPVLILSALCLALAPLPSSAEELGFAVGLGAAAVPDYEGSDDVEVVPLPYLTVSGFNGARSEVRLSGAGLESNLIDHPHWRLGVTAQYLSDYDDVDDDVVSQIRDTDDAVFVGATVGYDFAGGEDRQVSIEVETLFDAGGDSGAIITPRLQFGQRLSEHLQLRTGASVTWASDDFMGNRFSLSAADALRTGLPAYEAGAGVKDVSVDASLVWFIDRHWQAALFGRVIRFTGDAKDSPIVDERGEATNYLFGATLIRRF